MAKFCERIVNGSELKEDITVVLNDNSEIICGKLGRRIWPLDKDMVKK